MGEHTTLDKSIADTNGLKCDYRKGILNMYAQHFDEKLTNGDNSDVEELRESSDASSKLFEPNKTGDDNKPPENGASRSENFAKDNVANREQNNKSPSLANTTSFSVLDILDPRKFTGSTKNDGSQTHKARSLHPWLSRKVRDVDELDEERLRDDSGWS